MTAAGPAIFRRHSSLPPTAGAKAIESGPGQIHCMAGTIVATSDNWARPCFQRGSRDRRSHAQWPFEIRAMPAEDRPSNNPNITIVIPAFRASSTIKRAVDSALEQNNETTSVIVVVDGCDKTRDTVKTLKHPRVKILQNDKTLGAPFSRNVGLSFSATDYVSFLDADDYFMGDFLGALSKHVQDDGSDLGFGPNVQWSQDRGYYNYWVPDYRDHADAFMRWFGHKRNVTGCSMLWRTEYLRRIGGWNERILRNQDGELGLRAILLGARFSQSAAGCGVWYQHESATRITSRTDNLAALIDVADELMSIESPVVPKAIRIRATAYYFYRLAHRAFAAGNDSLGREALRRSRSLGFAGHLGSLPHIALSSILGLELKQRATRAAKRVIRHDAR